MESSQCCCQHHTSTTVGQSLDEMEFERGLWSAALNGEKERVQQLLKEGKDTNARDSSGYTALHYGARNGHADVCSMLLSNGACVNAQTRSGKVTPLHRAAFCGHISVVQLLLDYHADTSLIDSDGKNALHKACEKDHTDIVKVLHEHDVLLKETKDIRGRRPNDYTAHIEIYKILG